MANEIQVIRKQMMGVKRRRRQRGLFRRALLFALALTALVTICVLLANQLVMQKTGTANVVEAQEQKQMHSADAQTSKQTSGQISDQTSSQADNAIEWEDPVYEKTWNLVLVNRWNPITEYEEITFTELRNNHSVDSRIYPELQQMFDDARAAGLYPMISSSHRTREEQQRLYDEKISEYKKEGYSEEEAKQLAEGWVAIPGTSEHELGIAVDITTEDSSVQDASYIWNWLNENCYKYGFIQRYPEGKKELTGVNYEPWHYRYVGRETAADMYEQDLCLEEYLNN